LGRLAGGGVLEVVQAVMVELDRAPRVVPVVGGGGEGDARVVHHRPAVGGPFQRHAAHAVGLVPALEPAVAGRRVGREVAVANVQGMVDERLGLRVVVEAGDAPQQAVAQVAPVVVAGGHGDAAPGDGVQL